MYFQGFEPVSAAEVETKEKKETTEKKTRFLASNIVQKRTDRCGDHVDEYGEEEVAAGKQPSTSPLPPPKRKQEKDTPPPSPSSSSLCTPNRQLKETDKQIQEGLAIVVDAVTKRTKLIKENFEPNQKFSNKDDKFSGISNEIEKISSTTIGNQIYRVAKRAELNAAVTELDVKARCFLAFNEKKCIEFLEENMTIILQIAFNMFSRNITIQNKKSITKITKVIEGANQKQNRITIVTRNDNEKTKLVGSKGILVVQDGCDVAPLDDVTTKRVFNVRGVKPTVISSAVGASNKSWSTNDDKKKTDQGQLRPEERSALDLSNSASSYVFTTLRRIDPDKPVYLALKTLWQKKYHLTQRNRVRWTNVVGWDEDPHSKTIIKNVKMGDSNIFFFPSSFKQLAAELLKRHGSLLVKHARQRNKPSELKKKTINPSVDSPQQYLDVMAQFDECLSVLLSMSPESVFTKKTIDIYRRKYRRYSIFCLAMYVLNRDKHGSAVSPLPYNFFNFFSFMYANGREMYPTTYLSIMNFLYVHLFNLVASSPPAQEVKRLLDIDSTIMKGGKGAIRDFGSPVKTSIHTRTVVSYLGFVDNMMRLNYKLLAIMEGTSNKYTEKCAISLERWCDSVLFIFFTFVLFHRFSGIKKVTLEECLQLVLGKTHIHTNKMRAVRLVRMVKSGSLLVKEAVDENVVCFRKDIEFDSDDEEGTGVKTKAADNTDIPVSHPHLLGLPYSIQRALGLPVGLLNPLVSKDNISVGTTGASLPACNVDQSKESFFKENGKKRFGIDIPNIPEHVALENAATCTNEFASVGHIDMFENLISDNFDSFYGKGMFNTVVEGTMKAMTESNPFGGPDGHLSSHLGPGIGLCATGGAEEVYHSRDTVSRDVSDYLMASPMRLVFTILTDEDGNDRIMSIGDMALLAIWIKVSTLKICWKSPAINASNYSWISSTLCRHLLLTDLTNFGTLGDTKIINKIDCMTDTMHRDGKILPTEKEQLDFIRMTPLNDRKSMACLHGQVNVRTQSHLGRVTSTSWAVDAISTISKGDKAIFGKLITRLDVLHLGHTNAANFIPYFSTNFLSNEKENGLWGFVKRTSEKVVQENAPSLSFDAVNRDYDLGESLAVMDVISKRKLVNQLDCSSSSKHLNDMRRKIKSGKGETSSYSTKLKDLWQYRDMVDGLIKGRYESVICKSSGFLNVAVPDAVIGYNFDSDTNTVRLRVRILGHSPEEEKESEEDVKKRRAKNSVITLDSKITRYDKMGLTESREIREKLMKKDRQSRMASGIRKVLSDNTCLEDYREEEVQGKLLEKANKLAFTFFS